MTPIMCVPARIARICEGYVGRGPDSGPDNSHVEVLRVRCLPTSVFQV